MILIDDVVNGLAGTQYNAGSKARTDINTMFNDCDLYFLAETTTNQYFSRSLYFLKAYNKIKQLDPNEIYLIQYPQYIINAYSDILYRFLSKRKTILFIHDINSLRLEPDNIARQQREIRTINQFSVIVAHNQKMKTWLEKNGVTKPVVCLELFDYLASKQTGNEIMYDVAFAGNLEYVKSKFLYKAIAHNTDCTFQLFGKGFEKNRVTTTNVFYEGSKKPDTIINCFRAKFGLIWDGDSIDTCTGDYGNYERYNNPHKLSMNVAAEIPVIVWKEAAIADFVLKHRIGIVVEHLKNLHTVIRSVSDKDYANMKKNIRQLGSKVRDGYFTKAAITQASIYITNQ